MRLGDQQEVGVEGRSRARGRLVGGGLSVAAHLSLLAALIWVHATPPKEPELPPVSVSLVDIQAEPEPQPTPAQPSPKKPIARVSHVRPTPRPVAPPVLASGPPDPIPVVDVLSDAQVAGATSADSGPPGGACDMARWIQRALRKDKLVQAAVAGVHRPGKAIMVWNGDWVQSGGEDGKGLAAVREALLWEIAFAPAACRAERVHGLILLSLSDSPAYARLALGHGEWRWSDLLAPTGAVSRQ